MYTDCHCHLDRIPDFKDAIERARKAEVRMMANGIDPESNRFALEASRFENVDCALGIHPTSIFDGYEDEIEFITKNRDKISAIGEVGLDYKQDYPGQERLFQKLIELSEKIGKPLIVHTRKAESEVLDMLESSTNKDVVLHCFSGKLNLVKRAYDDGYSFSIPANVTRSTQFQRLVEEIPLSNLLTETDAPFLSPYQDKPNEPAFVVEAAKKIAEIKKMELTETRNNIFMNYKRLF